MSMAKAAWIKMPLGTDVGRGVDIVLDGDPAGGAPPQFSAHVCCGQTAGWIKMALGVEVGNWSRPHCARMGPSSPPQKGAEPSNFRSISIVAKWLDVSRYQDATLGMEI